MSAKHQQETSTAAPSGPGEQASTRTRPAMLAGWTGWLLPIVIGVVVGGVIAWWMWSSRSGDEETVAAQPIARIDAPDFHSLLVHPENPDRVLFGGHEGTQESRDGGSTWQPGTLRDADAMIMAASPDAPQTMYAAGHDLLQVSRDGGASWEAVSHNLPGTDIHGFAQNPADPERLYAFVMGFGGFTSADGGATWQPFPSMPPGGSYVVLTSNGTDLYAATDAGLARSRDDGATWEALANQPGKVTVLSLATSADAPETIYAGTPVGLVRSTDGGESWTTVGPTGVPAIAIAVAPNAPDRLFFLDDLGDVYRSDDAGATWS